jgi:hypothetical protein
MWLDTFMPANQTLTGRKAGKESDMDFTAVQHGCLATGTVTPAGTIEATSLTAYRMTSGEWVPFHKVHGAYKPVMPLVSLA